MISFIIKSINEIKNYLAKKKINLFGRDTKAYCWVFKRDNLSIINIGNNSLINGRLVTENKDSRIILGNNVFVGGKTIFDCLQEINVSDNVLISYECILSDHDSHSIESKKREGDLYKFQFKKMNWDQVNSKPIFIKKNAWIGMRSIILKGVTVGEGSIVAAGSVVTKDVPDYTLVAGNPAIIKKRLK
jgi:acetyltransferase-like isoleucine patch superfamily enzyme